PVSESPNPADHADQEGAVIALSQSLNAVRLAWQRIQFWDTRSPMPDAGIPSGPDISRAVLIEAPHVSNPVVFSVATNAALVNDAEPPAATLYRAHPNRAFTILEKRGNYLPGKVRILRELAALPACKPFESANPKSPVARREKLVNRVRRELLTRWRLPRDVPDAIEPKQTKFRSQPEI